MNCPYCNSQVIEGTEVCHNCGANLKQVQNQSLNQYTNNNLNNKKNNTLLIVLGCLLIVAAMLVLVNKVFLSESSNNNGNTQNIQETSEVSNKDTEESTTEKSTVIDNDEDSFDKDGAFLMAIEDIFTISGKGTVVTGRVQRGSAKVGDEVEIVGISETKKTTITEIVMFRDAVEFASAGDNAGFYLKDMTRDDLVNGQVIALPNSIKAYKKFEAEVYILSKEEGGRHTPFFNGYRPKIYINKTEIQAEVTLPENIESVYPGDKANIIVELTDSMAMEIGTEISIRENGQIIGNGKITKMY